MKPGFIGIGAQKCATSWIYDILADHPEAVVSGKKELDFFSYHYENGYTWYENHFPERKSAKAIGEISPSYFHEASVPGRVKRYQPDARILVSLRDPVERALSQHRHLIRIGMISGPDYRFETALADNPSYIEQGLYAYHLSRWLANFQDNQVLVLLMEDIKQYPEETARNVYKFLGISTDHQSAALYEKSNPSYVVRLKSLDSTIKTMRGMAKRTGFGPVWNLLGRLGAQHIYRRFNRKPSESVIPPISSETIIHLREVFREDILALENILGRSLKAWL